MQVLNRALIANPYNWGVVILMVLLGNMMIALVARSATANMASQEN